MNISLFYHKLSLLYFKKALALMLFAVFLTLVVPGLHIILFLLLIILGISYACIYFIYHTEVRKTLHAMKETEKRKGGNGWIVIKRQNSLNFFGCDGLMKASAFTRGKTGRLDYIDSGRTLFWVRKQDCVKIFDNQKLKHSFSLKKAPDVLIWNGREGQTAVLRKQKDVWALFFKEEKICTLSCGWMSVEKQKLFDPSSFVIQFEEEYKEGSHFSIIFLILFLEEYYVL